MSILFFVIIALALTTTGTVLQRRLPGTIRASERLIVTISAVYLLFQLSLAIPGLLGFLKPVWITFTTLFLTAVMLIILSRYTPEPLLKLPGGEHHDEEGLRWAAIALLALVGVVAIYNWLPILTGTVGYDDRVIYLTRIARWIQTNRINIVAGDDPRAIATPIPAALPALVHLLFFQSVTAIGIWNWLGWLFCGLAMYVAAARWLESRFAGIAAAAMILLAPALLRLIHGIPPFPWDLFFAITGLHFLAHGKERPQHAKFAHNSATIALACSASLQPDLPVSILLFAVLLVMFRPVLMRRYVLRNLAFFLVIAGWSHLYVWIKFGFPTAPMLADLFGLPVGATNPLFRDLISAPHSFLSLQRLGARFSSAFLPVPLSEVDAVLCIGAATLLTGIAGWILVSVRHDKSFLRDPLCVGLVLLSLVSIFVAPSLLWRETTLLAPVAFCGLGAGYLFQALAKKKFLSTAIAFIPALVTVVATIILIPSFRNGERSPNPPQFLQSYSLPDRVAVYRTDGVDLWTLQQPLSQHRTIIDINPQLDTDWAFFKAGRAGCDWLIMADSPLQRYRMPQTMPVPGDWVLISDETKILFTSPGWIRIVVYKHVTSRVV